MRTSSPEAWGVAWGRERIRYDPSCGSHRGKNVVSVLFLLTVRLSSLILRRPVAATVRLSPLILLLRHGFYICCCFSMALHILHIIITTMMILTVTQSPHDDGMWVYSICRIPNGGALTQSVRQTCRNLTRRQKEKNDASKPSRRIINGSKKFKRSSGAIAGVKEGSMIEPSLNHN